MSTTMLIIDGAEVENWVTFKFHLLGMLISRKAGVPLHQFRELFNAYAGKDILPAWFTSSSHNLRRLLQQHQDVLEVRSFHSDYFVFVTEPIPAGFEELRETILKDPNNESQVRGIRYAGPLKEECTLVDMDMFVKSGEQKSLPGPRLPSTWEK